MKKPFAALLAMNHNLGSKFHIVKYSMLSVLILSAAPLFFSCGSADVHTDPIKAKEIFLSSFPSPTPAVQCSDAATITAGKTHTVALQRNRTVVAVGDNTYGQLNVSSWTNITAIAAGEYHTLGLKDDRTVVAVGAVGAINFINWGQLDVSSWTNIKAIAAGWKHTVGLKKDGTVVAVGYNRYGQSLDVSSWTNITAIAGGLNHTVGLKDGGTVGGTVVAVGKIDAYTSQDGTDVSSWTNIKAISAGGYHTLGLKQDGTVVAVGNNIYGQLGVSSWTNITAIAGGKYHTVGLKGDGTVVAVGDNTWNQRDGNQTAPISSWTDIKAIVAGANYTIGIKGDGTIMAAGESTNGQLDVASLFTNIMPICGGPALAVNLDLIPPLTTAMVTGTMRKDLDGKPTGWYVSDVQITLLATDKDSGDSGVKGIYYYIDGTAAVVEESKASFAIVSEGTHTVTFAAADNANNLEEAKVMVINIDKTSPSISGLDVSSARLWPPNHKMVDVMIGGSAADGGSEIASTVITVTDEYGIYKPITVAGFGNAIPLEAWRDADDMDGRLYTITVVATDRAGNQSTGTTTVLVPHDMGGK